MRDIHSATPKIKTGRSENMKYTALKKNTFSFRSFSSISIINFLALLRCLSSLTTLLINAEVRIRVPNITRIPSSALFQTLVNSNNATFSTPTAVTAGVASRMIVFQHLPLNSLDRILVTWQIYTTDINNFTSSESFN